LDARKRVPWTGCSGEKTIIVTLTDPVVSCPEAENGQKEYVSTMSVHIRIIEFIDYSVFIDGGCS
jgi:hypothetical protein